MEDSDEEYSLDLGLQQKLLPFVIAIVIAGFLYFQIPSLFDTAFTFTDLFTAAGLGYLSYFDIRLFLGPKRIEVYSREVCLQNFFGQKREVSMSDIERVEVSHNLLTLEIKNYKKVIGPYGYDGFYKLVGDIKEVNPSLKVSGI